MSPPSKCACTRVFLGRVTKWSFMHDWNLVRPLGLQDPSPGLACEGRRGERRLVSANLGVYLVRNQAHTGFTRTFVQGLRLRPPGRAAGTGGHTGMPVCRAPEWAPHFHAGSLHRGG